MDQPTSNSEAEEDIKPENIGTETVKTLKMLIQKIKLDQESNVDSIPLADPVARAARYSGMSKSKIDKVLASNNSLQFNIKGINRSIIQEELMRMFLIKNHIPTVTELYNALDEKLPVYVDIDYFKRILIKMGYAFYKFPMKKSLRVMEKKSVTFERYNYLKKIQQFRKDNVPIVYIGLMSIGKDMEMLNLERTLQTDTEDIFKHILLTVSGESINNVKMFHATSDQEFKKMFKDWFVQLFILQNISPGTVCILDDSIIFRENLKEVPTWKSVKADMIEWLEERDIYCHNDMPKADLLDLIQNCTDSTENVFVLEHFVKTQNCILLKLPQSINGLSIPELMINFLNEKRYCNHIFTRNKGILPRVMFDIICDSIWKTFSNLIEMNEREQLQNDIELDNVLDGLVIQMKTLKIDEDDNDDDTTLPNFSDSD